MRFREITKKKYTIIKLSLKVLKLNKNYLNMLFLNIKYDCFEQHDSTLHIYQQILELY